MHAWIERQAEPLREHPVGGGVEIDVFPVGLAPQPFAGVEPVRARAEPRD